MRLTKKEREMLCRAAQFVLAGEWPWEHGDDSLRLSTAAIRAEAEALERGAEKLADHASGVLNPENGNG